MTLQPGHGVTAPVRRARLRRTVRLRLTLLYGGMFCACGAVLLVDFIPASPVALSEFVADSHMKRELLGVSGDGSGHAGPDRARRPTEKEVGTGER